ncbi:MAG: uroporphyrinogen decarboxylase family protein [bacterium]
MNSLERCVAAIQFAPPDRFPVIPVLVMQGAKELRLPLERYFRRGKHLAEGQMRLLEKYDHDAVFGFPHVVEDVLPFGAGLRYFETGPPSVDRMCIRDFSDLAGLKPPEPGNHEQLVETAKCLETLARRVKGDKLIIGGVIGSFSLPSMLMGTEKYIKLLFSREGEFETYFPHLMNVCIEYTSRWANMQLEAGADIIVIADGIASNSILRRHEFEQKALPVITELLARIKGFIGYEFVGEGQEFIQFLNGKGAHLFLLGSTDDMTACRDLAGGATALMGNINNIKLLRWSPERVEFEVKKLVDRWGPSGGLIIGNQGPEIPFHVPETNIHALVQAVRKYGRVSAAA